VCVCVCACVCVCVRVCACVCVCACDLEVELIETLDLRHTIGLERARGSSMVHGAGSNQIPLHVIAAQQKVAGR